MPHNHVYGAQFIYNYFTRVIEVVSMIYNNYLLQDFIIVEAHTRFYQGEEARSISFRHRRVYIYIVHHNLPNSRHGICTTVEWYLISTSSYSIE